MKRQWLLITSTLVAIFTIGSISYRLSRTRAVCYRCNIILISVNSLRADALPCYGYRLPTAPNLCSFAKNNILFTNAYANSNWTRPSTMSILTSLYPVSHGMYKPVAGVTLNPKITTLAQTLTNFGYQTTFVSNTDPHIGVELGFGRGFQNFQFTPSIMADSTVDAWYRAIDSLKTSNKQGKPAFLFLHTDHMQDYFMNIYDVPPVFPLDPIYHPPNITFLQNFSDATWKYAIHYLTITIDQSRIESDRTKMQTWLTAFQNANSVSEARTLFLKLPLFFQQDIYRDQTQVYLSTHDFDVYANFYRHLYDDSIRTFDEAFAKIIGRIYGDGLDRNTIIVFVSDHGDLLGDHHAVGQRIGLYKEETHIPLLMSIPYVQKQQFTDLTQHVDIFPTLLDLVGLLKPSGIAGISLADALTGQQEAPRNTYLISETEIPNRMVSIRTRDWRLIQSVTAGGATQFLYNLHSDPSETKNIVTEHPVIANRLLLMLNKTLAGQPLYAPKADSIPEWQNPEDRDTKINNGYSF